MIWRADSSKFVPTPPIRNGYLGFAVETTIYNKIAGQTQRAKLMANQYILRNIRALFINGFNEIELRAFCFDEPDFEDVHNQLSQSIGKDEMVQLLLEHANRRGLMEKLLTWAKENNPAKYEEHQSYYDTSQPPPTPLPPPLRPPVNPFYYGGPVLPENFVGHRQTVEFCRGKFTAPQPANIAISGERRIGKTSLLHYLHKFGPEEAWGQRLCLFLDCGVFGGALTPTTFWRQVLQQLRYSLDPTSPLLDQVIELATQPELSGQDFRRLLNSYYRLYPEQFVYLLLDEFELIFRDYNPDIETLLNDLRTIDLEPGNKFALITATRENLGHVCQSFNQETGLEFHGSFVVCHLTPFDEQETRYVVQTLLKETNVEFAEQELNYIWQLSQSLVGGAHPILVQVAGSLIFDFKKDNQNLIDYYSLEHKFEEQTKIYREEIPQAAPPQITGSKSRMGIDFELALNTLEQALPIDNPDLTLEFFNWARQFRKNIQAEQSQNASSTSSHDRDTIVEELTRLSLKITGLSFEQLASGQNLANLRTNDPVEADDPTVSVKNQIKNYERRIQKLKEIQALKGIDTEPHILIEIEDIEEKLEKLRRMLQ